MEKHHESSGALVASEARMSVADEPAQFLERASQLAAGFHALASLGSSHAHAAIFLASWCLELTLKAYLVSQSPGQREPRNIQHNLAALWSKASSLGLKITSTPPSWCVLLSSTHNAPYHQRYPSDVAAFIAPDRHAVAVELEALLALVKRSV